MIHKPNYHLSVLAKNLIYISFTCHDYFSLNYIMSLLYDTMNTYIYTIYVDCLSYTAGH